MGYKTEGHTYSYMTLGFPLRPDFILGLVPRGLQTIGHP